MNYTCQLATEFEEDGVNCTKTVPSMYTAVWCIVRMAHIVRIVQHLDCVAVHEGLVSRFVVGY